MCIMSEFVKEQCPKCYSYDVDYTEEFGGKDMFKCNECGEVSSSDEIIFENPRDE